jgi:hypothetical protein
VKSWANTEFDPVLKKPATAGFFVSADRDLRLLEIVIIVMLYLSQQPPERFSSALPPPILSGYRRALIT